jgi:hypothetical protein
MAQSGRGTTGFPFVDAQTCGDAALRLETFIFEESFMNRPIVLLATSLLLLNLAACDKPTVVNVPPPATTAVMPGPPGPAGSSGATGATGATGSSGEGTTVVVVPSVAASAPSN